MAHGIRVVPCKPVKSGSEVSDAGLIPADAVKLYTAAGRPWRLDEVCPYRLRYALSPERAARLEGASLTSADLERSANRRNQMGFPT